MATPIPARMAGTLSWVTYTRRPGFDTRTRPEMTFSLLGPYFRYTRSVFCLSSSRTRKFLMKPSSFRISHTRTFSFELGTSVFSCSARLALRMRVRRSATGSLFMGLPARLHDARDLALEGKLAEAEATQLEFAEIPARTPAELAAGVR